jgi:hypothetical protein
MSPFDSGIAAVASTFTEPSIGGGEGHRIVRDGRGKCKAAESSTMMALS